MINYSIYVNNIPHGTIQAVSRIEAVRLASAQYPCGGIHLSKVENWEITE